MDAFGIYFGLGLEHITDPGGYDHMLFLLALCAGYRVRDWKRVAILVTAFTLGHSLTLALSALNLVVLSPALVEFLIPVTIVGTCVYNIALEGERMQDRWRLQYAVAAMFGLIHGLGFSGFFRSLLGMEESIVGPLFAFNIGLEAGQLLIVAAVLGIGFLVMDLGKIRQKWWVYAVSGVAGMWAIVMAFERL